MVISGGALIATGIGGPAGAMLIGAGADTLIQKATTGTVDWGEVAVALGGLGGTAIATRLGATGLKATLITGATTGGGLAAYRYATSPGPHTPTGLLHATTTGATEGLLLGGAAGATGHTLTAASGKFLSTIKVSPGGIAGEGAVTELLYGARPGAGLPGMEGVAIPNRPTVQELRNLTMKHQVESAVTYKYGPGLNGGGGQCYLHSGDFSSVRVPIKQDSMFIYHTHPRGTPWPSAADKAVLDLLGSIGSPQRVSAIVPVGHPTVVKFGGSGYGS